MTRRDLLKLAAAAPLRAPSAPLPYFTDVAAKAGLVHPAVYGGVDHKKYILETNGCGIAFCNDLRLHFGPGRAEAADAIEIRWPSGPREMYRGVKANRILTLTEGEAARCA